MILRILIYGGMVPKFLQNNSESYSTNKEKFNSELKRRLHSLIKLHSHDNSLLEKYSSLKKLIRISARFLRILNVYRAKKANISFDLPVWLQSYEIKEAENYWARFSQIINYLRQYELLCKGLPISTKSDIFKLNPVFDYKLSYIRLGGRSESRL